MTNITSGASCGAKYSRERCAGVDVSCPEIRHLPQAGQSVPTTKICFVVFWIFFVEHFLDIIFWNYMLLLNRFFFHILDIKCTKSSYFLLKCVELQTYDKSGWNMRFLKREVQMFLQSVHNWSQKKQFCCSLSFVFSASNSHFGRHIATIGLDSPHFLAHYQTILFNCAEQK